MGEPIIRENLLKLLTHVSNGEINPEDATEYIWDDINLNYILKP